MITYSEDLGEGFYLSLIKGFRTDLATICIIQLIPWLTIFVNDKFDSFRRIYYIIFITVISLIEASGIGLYQEWGEILNPRGLEYLSTPSVVMTSVLDTKFLLLFILLLAVLWLLSRMVKRVKKERLNIKWFWQIGVILLGIVILFLGVRGGVQKLPLKYSSAYYSTSPLDNFIAVNNSYYLLNTVLKSKKENQPILSDEETSVFLSKYRQEIDSTSTPDFKGENVVMIVLEGWVHDVVKKKENVPYISELMSKSIVFDQMYSSGFRTDQGMLSLFSGVPAYKGDNLLTKCADNVRLPSLFKKLKENNYKTSFFYGGSCDFSNLGAYLLTQGVENLVGEDQLGADLNRMDWGVEDALVLEELRKHLNKEQQPFFSTVLTLSTHPPFDIPGGTNCSDTDNKDSCKYAQSLVYLDNSIRDFMNESSSQPWFQSTIFIFTADHGSTYYGHRSFNDHERFRIPFFIYDPKQGNARLIKHKTSLHDAPTMIMYMLGIEYQSEEFKISVNPFEMTHPVYWSTNSSSAWITDSSNIVIDNEKESVINSSNTTDSLNTEYIKNIHDCRSLIWKVIE